MRKHWILAVALIIAISTSACGNKAPAAEPQQQETQEPAKPDVEAANPEQQVNDGNDAQEGAFKIPDFTSQDLDENEVTSEYFADNKLTVVNVWTTT